MRRPIEHDITAMIAGDIPDGPPPPPRPPAPVPIGEALSRARRVECPRCGEPAALGPGRNLPGGLGTTGRPPRYLPGWPAFTVVEAGAPIPARFTPTYLITCPRCGVTSYPPHQPVESVPDPEASP
jgi:ribosomal protein S27AE